MKPISGTGATAIIAATPLSIAASAVAGGCRFIAFFLRGVVPDCWPRTAGRRGAERRAAQPPPTGGSLPKPAGGWQRCQSSQGPRNGEETVLKALTIRPQTFR
jgi:hypothetical protein